jgi:hypothetical protein
MGVEVRLTSHIAQYEQRVRGRLAEVTAEAARYCVTAAQIDCPVDTGALQASIHAEQQGPMTFTIIAGGGPVDYAAPVEFGHRTRGGGYVPGRYFLTKARMKTSEAYQYAVEKVLSEES